MVLFCREWIFSDVLCNMILNMKKCYILVIALFAIAISCTIKENPVENVIPQEAKEFTFQINGTISELVDSETKTSITEDGSVFHSYWVNGNTIRVDFDAVTNSPTTGTYSTSNGNFTCSKSGLSEGSHTLYAAYPSATGRNDADGYTRTIPTTQTIPAVNAICEAADHLVATPKDIVVDGSGSIGTVDMVFNRHTAILKIIPVDNTTGKILGSLKIKKISISYPTKINTKIKVNKDGTTVTKIDTGASSFEINYDGDDFAFNTDVTGTDGAYLVVAPGQFTKNKDITFSIETDDASYIITKLIASLPDDITFGANELRPITISFGDANVVIDTTPVIVPDTPSKLEADASDGSFTYSVTNPDGVSEVSAVKKSGDWISSVAASAGTVTFNCTTNTGDERTAVITLSYPGADDVDVTITQKALGGGGTYTWGFVSSNTSDTVANTTYTWNSDTVGQTISYDGKSSDSITEYPSKSGIYCLKMNGDSSSGSRRYFTYTAASAGTLRITGYQQGENDASLTVKLGSDTVSANVGSPTAFASGATECVYTISGAGTVKFYTTGKAYFKSVVFTY